MGKRTILLFPGQGSAFVGMGRDFYENHGAAKALLDRAQAAAGFDLLGLCFEGPQDELVRTEFQQPCVLAVSVAAYQVLKEVVSLEPVVAIGHSLGEYTALVASGALRLEDAVSVTRRRGAHMQEAVPEGRGGMAALLGTDRETAEEICSEAGGEVWVANLNGAGQVVLSGSLESLASAKTIARSKGVRRWTFLPVSAPFHCPLMEPAALRLHEELSGMTFSPMAFPVIANVDAKPNDDPARIADLLVRQVTSRVRFEESIRLALDEFSPDLMLEIGPGGKLTSLIRRMTSLPCHPISSCEEMDTVKESFTS